MSPLFTVITIGISIIIGYTIYIIMDRKQQAKTNAAQTAETMLDDTSYIQEMKHLSGKIGFVLWQQYDFLLATHPFYWEAMVDSAAYMESADFDSLDSLKIGAPGENDLELAHVYNQNKVGLKNFERLKEEQGSLSIAGHSRTLNDSVKIVWFNQTRVLRVFALINDDTLITKYVETVIRRTFGTPDAMKLAKPVPQQAD
jgi:hypothetical protein